MEADTHHPRETNLSTEDRWDWITPVFLLCLCVMSVLFIQSAQAYDGGNEWKRQIIWCVIGFFIYFGFSLLDYKIFLKYAHILYGLSIFSLLLVLAVLKYMGQVDGWI